MCAKLIELGSDIFLSRLDRAITALEPGIALVHPSACGFGLLDPIFAAGSSWNSSGCNTAFVTAQSVWPQTMMCNTFKTVIAYSMVAVPRPSIEPYGGTRLPAFLRIPRAPEVVCVRWVGSIRESE